MRVASLIVLTVVALLALPGPSVHGAAAPDVTTGEAKDVAASSATLTGTVDPNGSPTEHHFEYGLTTAYGSQTLPGDAGDESSPIDVQAGLSALAADTTYHYRLVATSGGEKFHGVDRVLRTRASPRPPTALTDPATDVGPQTATLNARIDPGGSPTTYRFEYGPTNAYGAVTPDQSAGADDEVDISAPLAGLQPNVRYHYRVVAANAAGTAAGRDRTFITNQMPTEVTVALRPPRVPWGSGVVVTGRVLGSGLGRIPVVLERQWFTSISPFTPMGLPIRAERDGRFRIGIPALWASARLRVVTHTAVVVVSPVVTAFSKVRVELTKERRGGRARLAGFAAPAAPGGHALLQRRGTAAWAVVRRTALRPLSDHRSRYAFTVPARRKGRRYRVVVVPNDGGAHVTGTSRGVLVRR